MNNTLPLNKGKGACVLIWISSRGADDECDERWVSNCDAVGKVVGELECSVCTNGRMIVI